MTETTTRRGTSNGNQRGSSYARRARRAWIMATYASDVPGYGRCFRCGTLLYNPDDHPDWVEDGFPTVQYAQLEPHGEYVPLWPLTIDRIVPGCKGGTYARNNIRPACGACNSELGGSLSRHKRKGRK